MGYTQDQAANLDACIKCSACSAQCPVAAVYPLFPGPKSAGPDSERLRLEGLEVNTAYLSYCSNCKTCEVTCPSGVKITEMISRARETTSRDGKTNRKSRRQQVRDHVLGRAEYLGKLGTILPGLTNRVLGLSPVRGIMESTLGISRQAALPAYRPKLKTMGKANPASKQVVYFPGCFVTYNDSRTGQAVVNVLRHNGYEVIVPKLHCCGVPLQANGHFRAAGDTMRENLSILNPYLQADLPVITSCTSCGLALKEEYPKLNHPGAARIGGQTFDLFEFLWKLHENGELNEDFRTVPTSLGYHAPCHLKAQGIGIPSLRLLRLIPGVKLEDLDAGCCGLSGSYGLKADRYDLAQEIGRPLFTQVRQSVEAGEFATVVTECGGCQIQIQHGSGAKTEHPVWTVLRAYGLIGPEIKDRR